mmetsp:Transcript_137971/g.428793  ORF Transcript_137971/g.428793 Transcript_137971/m.428793 type:complete len:201 (+) Transcript_137971:309-911(+)
MLVKPRRPTKLIRTVASSASASRIAVFPGFTRDSLCVSSTNKTISRSMPLCTASLPYCATWPGGGGPSKSPDPSASSPSSWAESESKSSSEPLPSASAACECEGASELTSKDQNLAPASASAAAAKPAESSSRLAPTNLMRDLYVLLDPQLYMLARKRKTPSQSPSSRPKSGLPPSLGAPECPSAELKDRRMIPKRVRPS